MGEFSLAYIRETNVTFGVYKELKADRTMGNPASVMSFHV